MNEKKSIPQEMTTGVLIGMLVAAGIAGILVAAGVISIKLLHGKKHASNIDEYAFDPPPKPYQPPPTMPVHFRPHD